jgi:hypothetical protein
MCRELIGGLIGGKVSPDVMTGRDIWYHGHWILPQRVWNSAGMAEWLTARASRGLSDNRQPLDLNAQSF